MANADQDDLRALLLAEGIGPKTQLLTEIIKAKRLHKLMKSPQSRDYIEQLSELGKSSDPRESLQAISTLCKIGRLVKSSEREISQVLSRLLKHPIPELLQLIDPDDRFYAAAFWRFTKPSWAPEFFAESILMEESAESVREELSAGLIATTAKYSDAISFLVKALSDHRFATEKPGNSMARRLKRTIVALQRSIFQLDPRDPGEDFGPVVREMIRTAFSKSEDVVDTRLLRDAASAILDFVSSVSRLRLIVAFDSETYGPLFSLRDWFKEDDWESLLSTDAGRRFRNDIAGALEVAVRGGKFDSQLLNLLKLACADGDDFDVEIAAIIERNLGLSPESIAWLQGKSVAQQTRLSEESQLARAEAIIANLMRLRLRNDVLATEVTEEVLPSLASFQSIPSFPLGQLLRSVNESSRTIGDLGRERDLHYFGDRGEVVDFSRLEHETSSDSPAVYRKVMIAEPGILAISQRGSKRVVLRAIVRPV